ncbi:hypothetical protein HNP46_002158 [Pseudomonas nitritireducens]|uniref:Uncharacterized protein n=1 Tax=Pseudomonas nitroreducens TaxID=46680 RepID=A0A7W7KIW7_PSENT|nr:hypothetical protein [Pseudomonas nitritireducens]MBB4863311.1 hypothetical protein [Pseudomonas nitritireducens]
MTEQQACTLCGAGGHTAAQCNWNKAEGAQVELHPDLKRVYDVIGLHYSHPVSILIANFENTKRFAELLHAVEREFFMVPAEPSDEPEDEGCEPDDVCLMSCWGSTQEQYIEQFRDALAVLQARAAQAQPSPAPELERPEVAGWRDRVLAAHPDSDPRYWPDALLVQHMAAEIEDLRARNEWLEQVAVEAVEADKHALGLRDAAQARVTELELKLDTSDYAYDCLRIHMCSQARQALERAKVFDDGSDGADAESARSVVAILEELLADAHATVAQAGQVPEGWRVMRCTSSIQREGDRWEIYDPQGSGGVVSEHDVKDLAVRGLLDAIAAAPAQGGE